MNKQEMLSEISNRTGASQTSIETVLSTYGALATEVMRRGEKITLLEVGILEGVDRAERLSRNPATGEPITVPAKRAGKLKVSAKAKDRINS